MFKKIILSLSFLVLFCGLSYCADPKAIIDAKPAASIGESVWLRTTGSSAKMFQWKVLPPNGEESFTVLPIFGGMDKMGVPIVNYWAHFSSMNPGTFYFVLIATEDNKSDVAIHTLVYGGGGPNPPVPPTPPTPDIPQPSADLVALVKPIADLFVGDKATIKKDSANLSAFYMDMAETIERDRATQVIKTTDNVRQTNISAGKLMFQNTGIKGRYPGLGEAIDKALAAKLGLDIVDLTDAKRTEVVNMFKALAWICGEVAKK